VKIVRFFTMKINLCIGPIHIITSISSLCIINNTKYRK